MAEDDRLDQIKEGAGLEDSRINQEFVDFIRKWSTPVLLVAALITLGYFLNNKRIDARAAYINEAFSQLNQSTSSTGGITSFIMDPGLHVILNGQVHIRNKHIPFGLVLH